MKILLVDDHVLIRDALRAVLRELRRNAQIFPAADWTQGERLLRRNRDISLVVLDLKLPDRDGFEVLASLRREHARIGVVVLSAHEDAQLVARALRMGARGFIPKSAGRDIVLGALSLVLAGGVYIPPQLLEEGAALGAPAGRPRLTRRQLAVLALMMHGKSNKAIARRLNVAEPTVKNHVTVILKALKASNRTEAVIAAGALGLDRLGAVG